MRPLVAHFSPSALRNNLQKLKGLAPNSEHCAVIKANAYGHRIENLLPILAQEVDYLAVAMIEEALEIRRAGGELPILLLEGLFTPDEYLIAAEENFAVVISSSEQLQWLLEASLPTPLEIYLKVDTGMHRLGVTPERATELYPLLTASKNVAKLRLMTHFACADEKHHPLTERQIEAMQQLEQLDLEQSMANSAALLTNPQTHKALVRFGIALYGVSPIDGTVGADFGLQPLITLKSRIIHRAIIEEGESVGYGAKFTAPERMPIGVIAGGYADGYPREITEEAYVLVGGYKAHIIGRPAMDMMMIDLRSVPESAWDEEVEIFGDNLPIEQVALWAGTIPYTIFTHLAKRIHFKEVE